MELFSPYHLLILAVVAAVLFFGWKQLPDMSRSLGRSLRILKTEIKGMTEDDKARAESAEPKAIAPAAVQPAATVQPVATAQPAAVVQQAAQQPVARPAAQPTPHTAATASPRPRPTPRGSAASGVGGAPR